MAVARGAKTTQVEVGEQLEIARHDQREILTLGCDADTTKITYSGDIAEMLATLDELQLPSAHSGNLGYNVFRLFQARIEGHQEKGLRGEDDIIMTVETAPGRVGELQETLDRLCRIYAARKAARSGAVPSALSNAP